MESQIGSTYRIGVEEFIAAIAVSGRADAAKGVLVNTYGKISAEEERGRMMTAQHSLLARGLMAVTEGVSRLEPAFQKVMDVFFSSKTVIRTGKTGAYTENVLNYYQTGDGWLEHSNSDGVVHQFTMPIQVNEIEEMVTHFLSPVCGPVPLPVKLVLPSNLLTELNPGQRRSFDAVLEYCETTQDESPELRWLAEDFSKGPWRGSTIFVRGNGPESILTSGFLWLQGTERLWAIYSKRQNEDSVLLAELCDRDQFEQYLRAVIFPKI
jgi:hypothetical protein